MASEPDGDRPQEDADAIRRAAQDSVAELARMGIDPRMVGLTPTDPPPPLTPPASAGGRAGEPASASGRATVGGQAAAAGDSGFSPLSPPAAGPLGPAAPAGPSPPLATPR